MAGRRESPLDPGAGPLSQLAYELRALRESAGSPTYREMALRTGCGASTLSQAAAGERLPSLPTLLAYVAACGGEPGEWERRWQGAAADETAARRPADPDAPVPYRGLARFELADRELFFGRDELVARLAESVRHHRLVAVVGASGSGKSSLLRAGLIPALRSAEAPAVRPAAVRILTPGPRPAASHAHLLVPERPERGPGAGGGNGDTVVVVDQFEELFTLSADDGVQRTAFLALLMSAVASDDPVRVVIAVRADFFGRCAEHPGLADALRDSTVLVAPMGPAELREAVVRPAAAAGLIVERSLTARVVREAGREPGSLPLMSHALLETWRRRRGRSLTEQMYEAAGGIHGAIAATAEDVYTRLSPSRAAAARRILLRLVTPGEGAPDTRRPTGRAELEAATPEAVDVLEQLVRARLLTSDGDTVDLAHEALLSAWPRFRSWVEEDRERLRLHRRLTEAARSWDELGRDTGALYRGTRLTAALDAFAPPTDPARTDAAPARAGSRRGRTPRDPDKGSRTDEARTGAASDPAGAAEPVGARRGHTPRDPDDESRTDEARTGAAPEPAGGPEPVRSRDPAGSADPAGGRVGLTPLEVAFLDAGRAAHDHERRSAVRTTRRLRLLTTVLTLLLVLAVAAGSVAWRQSRASDAARRRAVAARQVALSRQLAADSTALAGTDAELSMLLAVQAYRTSPTAEATAGLYRAAAVPLRRRLTAATGPLTVLAFSHDGRTLALGADDGTVVRADTATGRTTPVLPPGDNSLPEPPPSLSALAFSADDRGLVAGYLNGRALTVDLATGKSRVAAHGLPDSGGAVLDADGRTLLYGPAPGSHGARARDTATGRSHTVVPDFHDLVAVSPDGRTTVADDSRGTTLWDTATGRREAACACQVSTFSRDGRTLAGTGHDSGTVTVWRWTTKRPATTIRVSADPTDLTGALRLSPDGSLVATGSNDGSVHLWDTATGRSQSVLSGYGAPVALLAFSDDGRTLAAATSDGMVRLFDTTTGIVPAVLPAAGAHSSERGGAVFLQHGTVLATGEGDGTVQLWTAGSRRRRATLRAPDPDYPVQQLSAGADGRTLAGGALGTVRVWDTVTGRSRTIGEQTIAYALSPDGRTLATVREGQGVDLWDTAAARPRPRHVTGTAMISFGHLMFSPDGKVLAARDWLGSVHLLDVASGRALRAFGGVGVRYSGTPGDVRTTARVAATSRPMAFSPDGRTLAATGNDGTSWLWDIRSGKVLATLTATSSPALGVAFSPDGRTLAVGSADGATRLWDLATRQLRATVTASTGAPAASVLFSPDGRSLVVGGTDGSLRVWAVRLPRPSEAIAAVCAAVGREPTPQERAQYLPAQPLPRACPAPAR